MKRIDELDPVIREAVENVSSSKELYGGIVPDWLAVAIPPIGTRVSKMNLVALLYIVDVIAAHRIKGEKVFWRGKMFQVNRHSMATRFGCEMDDISKVQTHFKKHGWISVVVEARRDNGEYRGKSTYVVPNVPEIIKALKEAELKTNSVNIQNEVKASKPEGRTLLQQWLASP
jgi:hypothetical protein